MTKRVVFTTYNAGRDGNSRDDLDCIIHSTPTSNVEQSVGRILRPLQGKPVPIVMDLIDTEGPLRKSGKDKDVKLTWFVRSAEDRIDTFEKNNWDIEIIKLGDV